MKIEELKDHLLGIKDLSQKEQVMYLYSIVNKLLTSQSSCFRTSFLLKNFISRDIEFLLSLLESPTAPIRKLSLLLICLVCQNPFSKTYLMEKCGLSLIIGKFLLTRLKFIQKWSHDEISSFTAMNTVMKKLQSYPNISSHSIFFYIPLNIELRKMPRDFRPKVFELNIKQFFPQNSQIKLEGLLKMIPDPVFNLCGMDLLHEDVQIIISIKSKIDYDHKIENLKKKQRKSHMQDMISADKYQKEKFNQSTQSTIHQSSHSKSNFQEIKSLILNQRSKNNIIDKFSLLTKHKLKNENKNKEYDALPIKSSHPYKKNSIRGTKPGYNHDLMTLSNHSTTNSYQSKTPGIFGKKKKRNTVKAPNSVNLKYMNKNFMQSLNNDEIQKKKTKLKESNNLNYLNEGKKKNILIDKYSKMNNYAKFVSQMESNNLKNNSKKKQFC